MKGESGFEQKKNSDLRNPDFSGSNYTTASLEDVNVRGLVEHLTKGVPYVSDGYYGPRETAMVERIIEEFGKNSEFKAAVLSVAPILSSGGTAELALRDMKKREAVTPTPESVISYLSSLHANVGDKMDGKGAVTRVSGKNIAATLARANKEGRLVQYVNDAVTLSGREVSFKSIEELATALKTDTGLKYSIID